MNIRHLATKNFDTGVIYNQAVIVDKLPVVLRGEERKITSGSNMVSGIEYLRDSEIGDIVLDSTGEHVLPLGSLFGYNGFEEKFEEFSDTMRGITEAMFTGVLPDTGEPDVDKNAFYAPYVPLAVLSGCLPAQDVDGEQFFNPNGVVTIAEFLDGLTSISGRKGSKKVSLDNISGESDYFNEGYRACLRGMSSPFFNLYTRHELMEPITRAELAYLTVICWERFIEKYNSLYGSVYYLGVNFDWTCPHDALQDYYDGNVYKISQISTDEALKTVSLNIKDYKGDRTMSDYIEAMQAGRCPIPLPMIMSIIELDMIDVFPVGDNLYPFAEVSRGEMAYFLVRLATKFTQLYRKL